MRINELYAAGVAPEDACFAVDANGATRRVGLAALQSAMAVQVGAKTITENGTYDPADDGLDAYSAVTVDVSGGGGDVPLLTKAQWDALSAAQKQAYGLVAVQTQTNRYNCGTLYNGALAVDSWIIDTDNDVIAEASLINTIDNGSWGFDVLVEGATQNQDGTINSNGTSSNTTIPISVMLPTVSGSFTAYAVVKYVSGGNRIMMSFGDENSSTNNGMGLLNGANSNANASTVLSLWGNDTTIPSSSNGWMYSGYRCVALAYDAPNGVAYGFVLSGAKSEAYSLSKQRPTRASSRIVLGKTFPTNSTAGADERTNVQVAYLGVTNGFDGLQAIAANMAYIASQIEDRL